MTALIAAKMAPELVNTRVQLVFSEGFSMDANHFTPLWDRVGAWAPRRLSLDPWGDEICRELKCGLQELTSSDQCHSQCRCWCITAVSYGCIKKVKNATNLLDLLKNNQLFMRINHYLGSVALLSSSFRSSPSFPLLSYSSAPIASPIRQTPKTDQRVVAFTRQARLICSKAR